MTADEKRDLQNLIDRLSEQNGSYDIELIKNAYEFSVEAHRGQKRFTNEPYYIHPYNIALIVISMGLDSCAIAAALLHDVVEDTEYTLEDIRSRFGGDVAHLVDGVTKIGRLSFTSKEQQQAESLRKMLIAMGEDIRVIIIKLADRLHNMRTIDAVPEQKQRDKSLETIEIYAPIAHRLGIRSVKEELEDISIKHLDPIAYHEIEELLQVHLSQREQILQDIRTKIEERLKAEMPNVEMKFQGRVKSVHGIYRKMYQQGRDFDEIYDVYAIRIITNTVADCYNILGIMHDMFRPIPNRFKDYISTPKPNKYQSLHTTLLSRAGIPFEIQIRTFEMHHTAEFGIAAHWKYKEGVTENNPQAEENIAWIRQILADQESSGDASELMQSIKVDLSQEEVFGVTPKGDVITLPMGATVVDFAFAIHSQVGVRMVGAKVDGRIVPINHEIKTGEVIEILTTNQQGHGPSRDWMKIAVTNQAKAKIRSWFKRERRDENIVAGRFEIERELKRNGMKLDDDAFDALMDEVAKKIHCNDAEDLFATIGYGGILLSKILPRIREEYNRRVQEEKPVETFEIKTQEHHHANEGVVVEGIDNCLVKLSKCCAPLPGDEIIGFITRGHGVSVHKRDCNNVPRNLADSAEPDRWIKVHWENSKTDNFISTLQISAMDRDGLLVEIMTVMQNMRVPIHSVNARQQRGGIGLVSLTLSAESVEHLNSIIARLKKLSNVFGVERIHQ